MDRPRPRPENLRAAVGARGLPRCAGSAFALTADSLRTSGVEIYGVAKGLSPEVIEEVYGRIVRWAQHRTLTFDLEKVPLSEIETAWQRTDVTGRRLVVVP